MKNYFFFKNYQNINLHISEQRLEIERNGHTFEITCSVDVHSKTFFEHFDNFKNFKKLKKTKKIKKVPKLHLSRKQLTDRAKRLKFWTFFNILKI